MLSILLLWLLLLLTTFLWGRVLTRLFRQDTATALPFAETLLAGIVGMVAITQLLSIFFPADYRLTSAVLACAVGLRLRSIRQDIRQLNVAVRTLLRQNPVFWLLLIVVLLYVLLRPANADSGMYHLPSLRWYERFRVVPGLGNLHGRLAFNSSFLVASAAWAWTDVAQQPLFPLNGFLVLIFGGYCLHYSRQTSETPAQRTLLMALLFLTLYYLIRQVGSPTPDVWAAVLPLFVFLLWLKHPTHPGLPWFWLMTALCLLSITIKLSTLPLLLSVGWLVAKHRSAFRIADAGRLALLISLIVVPWLVRNIILSGYLLYPFPSLDLFSVDWKIPAATVQYEADIIMFCGRFRLFEAYFQATMLTWPFMRWVAYWWHTPEFYWLNRPLMVLAALSPLVLAGQWFSSCRRHMTAAFPAYVVALFGVMFWFIKAPDLRFGYAFVWFSALLPWVRLVRAVTWPVYWLPSAALLVLLVYFVFVPVKKYHFSLLNHWRQPEKLSIQNHLSEHTSHWGVRVLRPEPAPFQQSCYDVAQPCSPYVYQDLQYRGRDLRNGFRRKPFATP